MRFKDFLAEEEKFSLDGYRKSLETIIERELYMFRASRTFSDSHLLNLDLPNYGTTIADVYEFGWRTSPRDSLSGNTNTFMNISTTWKGFPNRKLSYFCTQSLSHAHKNFDGTVGLVIPSDKVKVFGWIPKDFNEIMSGSPTSKKKWGFYKIFLSVRSLLDALNDLLTTEDINPKQAKLQDEVKKLVNEHGLEDLVMSYTNRADVPADKIVPLAMLIDDMIPKYKEFKAMSPGDPFDVAHTLYKVMEELKTYSYSSCREMFDDINPNTYGAKVCALKDIPVNYQVDDEVWFEGSYLLVTFPRDFNKYSDTQRTDLLKSLLELY